jgi:integrase
MVSVTNPRFTYVGKQKDADKALVHVLAASGNGTYVETDRTALGKYVTDFLERQKAEYSGTTWQRFESMARMHVVPTLGSVNKVYAAWRGQGLSEQTVVHHHRFVHRVLAQAVREGRLRQNVAMNANKPRAVRREMRSLTTEEVGRLIAAASGTVFAALVTVALACGARRGELLAAKWDDADFGRGTLAIRRALEQTKAGVAEKVPKSGKSRVIHLPQTAPETLRRHRISQGRIRPGYIFPGDAAGNPWIPQKVSDGFRALAKKPRSPERPSTHSVTRAQVCFSGKECTRRWSRKCSGTQPSRSRWTCTAMPRRRYRRRLRLRSMSRYKRRSQSLPASSRRHVTKRCPKGISST